MKIKKFFLRLLFLQKTRHSEMTNLTRGFSFKMMGFDSVEHCQVAISRVLALKTNGLRRHRFLQFFVSCFSQCVYRGASIENDLFSARFRKNMHF